MQISFSRLAATARRPPSPSPSSAPALAQKVRFVTSAGDIVVEVDAAKAPKTVANFLQYVKAGHYDGTIFHRVIANFMIQGGGMTADMKEKETRPPIVLESKNGLTNERGTIAMARTSDPNSATAQFFINVKDNDFLNQDKSRDGNGYAVFGKVDRGHGRGRQDQGHADRPGRRPGAADHHQESNRGEMSDETSRSGNQRGNDPRRARRREGARDGQELPHQRRERPLRRHRVPPRHQGLHGPGRRLRARHERRSRPARRSRTRPTTA